MKNTVYSHILDDFAKRLYLFETREEVDGFLSEAVSRLMEQEKASVGAVFVFDETAGELVFRVGYDNDEYWDSSRCFTTGASFTLSVDGSDVGRAFNEGSLNIVSFEEGEADHPFRTKVYIPIVRGPEKTGVFVMAHREANAFAGIRQAGIMKAVSRLGDMLAEAMILVNREEKTAGTNQGKSFLLKGMKTSEGYVGGRALPLWTDLESVSGEIPPQGSPEKEKELFQKALSLSLQQLEEMQNTAASNDTEMISLIFTAQYYMLKDKKLSGRMEELIEGGESAPRAVRTVIDDFAARFSRMSEIRLAEKAQDVRDLGFRLISNMGTPGEGGFSYEGQIILSRHIYPSDLFRLAVEKAAGLVLQGTGVTAHISILARSLHLPVLITDDKALQSISEGTPLLLDATGGRLYINPSVRTIRSVRAKRDTPRAQRTFYTLKGATSEGTPVSVSANVNLYTDARDAVTQGAEGIGLYRSEFPFIIKKDFLSEEQQYRIYRSIILSQSGKPVIMRTTDIGGDKLLQGRSEAESNPFLGVRGIRFSLANREMFRDQLRAMLRAGAGEDLGILLPMVSDVEEVLMVREELELCRDQLQRRGVDFNRSPRLGAMIELPSAALSVDEIARETDFMSIGTNDLTMYLLAVDRTNENLGHLYRSHHPTVLKMLASIASDAGDRINSLSVCGDTASDPVMIAFYIGLGIRSLSVIPSKVEFVKQILSRFSVEEARNLASDLLAIRRIGELDVYLKEFREKHSLNRA